MADGRPQPTELAEDLPLFVAAQGTADAGSPQSPLEAAMEELKPDAMTPREALQALYRLKELLDPGTKV